MDTKVVIELDLPCGPIEIFEPECIGCADSALRHVSFCAIAPEEGGQDLSAPHCALNPDDPEEHVAPVQMAEDPNSVLLVAISCERDVSARGRHGLTRDVEIDIVVRGQSTPRCFVALIWLAIDIRDQSARCFVALIQRETIDMLSDVPEVLANRQDTGLASCIAGRRADLPNSDVSRLRIR